MEQRQAPRTQRVYVNVDDVAQRRYWSGRLACNEAQLREGIREVGSMVEDLRRYLGNYVSIDTARQRRHWCRKLNCGEAQLVDTVFAVGLRTEDVRARLRMLRSFD